MSTPQRPLNDAEAQTIASELAGLARSGLPLAEGLRALADELGHGPVVGVLRELSDRIERGASLQEALDGVGDRLPSHLRGLIAAGAASSRLDELLEEYVDLRRDQAEQRHRMWLAVAYPLVLVGLLAALFILFTTVVVPQFADIFMDFGCALPSMTKLVLSLSRAGVLYVLSPLGVIMGLVYFAVVGPAPRWMRICVYAIPVFGPFWRWSRLTPFARLMALFVEQQIPVGESLRLTAAGVADRHLAAACRQAAKDVDSGRPLAEALTAAGMFPASGVPLVEWGSRFGSLGAAFRFMATAFEGRTRLQVDMARIIALPIAMCLLLVVGFVVIALFLPLISLIQHLGH